MPPRARSQYHPQNETPSGWRLAGGCGLWFLGIAALVSALAADLPGLGLGLSLALTLLSPVVVQGGWRHGVRVDDQGLTERHWLRPSRHLRWDELTDVRVSDDEALLLTPTKTLRLAPPLANWLEIANRAERYVRGEPLDEVEDDGPPVLAEDVARWLGIAPDATLVCTGSQTPSLIGWATASVVLAVFVLGWPFAIVAGLIWTALGVHAVQGKRRADRRVTEVRADASGLDVKTDAGWRKYGWAQVRRVDRRGLFTVVGTTAGDIWLPPGLSNTPQLLGALHQAIAARGQGLVLPRLTGDVPATALSRAGEGAHLAGAERGISVVRGPAVPDEANAGDGL